MTNSHILFPIALDLGAKTTGVFAAGYRADTHIDTFTTSEVCKTAFVVEVDATDKGYKLLQSSRTVSRHSRRGRTRNKQAKKLLNLALERVYHFPIAKHEKAISHFMNRRGYTYLEDKVDSESLDLMPSELLESLMSNLPGTTQEAFSEVFGQLPLWEALQSVSQQDESHLDYLKQAILHCIASDKKAKKIYQPLFEVLDYLISERESGSKHRREYFSKIRNDLLNLRRHPRRECRRLFHAINDHKKVHKHFFDNFISLVCHINNFDLKTLNAILRDIQPNHTPSEIEQVIAKRFGKWIMKQWQTSQSNGPQKLSEITSLRRDWQAYSLENPDKVFAFWAKTPPELTIPPYESHTNRRPPSCQTLTFNPDYLDSEYPKWRTWLQQLEYQGSSQQATDYFRHQLASVTSAKRLPLVSDSELDARTFQFILDRTHEQDRFKLNATWASWKKYQQLQRSSQSTTAVLNTLQELSKESELPDSLRFVANKAPLPSSFWHLVFKYYQLRRRAKDGRYFLHYDNLKPKTQRWERDGKLMVMCQHRPRQLKHQSHQDICVLLGLQPQQLSNALLHANTKEVSELFSQVRGLKTACQDGQRAQKAFGVELNTYLKSDKALIKLCNKLSSLLPNLAETLQLTAEQTERFCQRNDSLFIFAQLYPMVWGDRSGFGKTCPVCASDNAARMAGHDGQPKASRLHTLSMRLIDGGLKRLLNHKAHHLANRLFPMIEQYAKSAEKVTVPIIIEQNSFDFTENLHKLKGVSGQKNKLNMMDPTLDRNARIKSASHALCPYASDQVLTDVNGDLDHIIPRSGRYGTLNDEANLIYASHKGNRDIKKNRELSLSELSPLYLQRQFGTQNTQEIEQIIVARLKGSEGGKFRFGRYTQFVALTEDEQVAFRHALFLAPTHPIRQQVIKAIQHRNKTRVNGTQRYMAQLVADILIKKAQQSSLSGRLEFDYFEVSANGKDEDSTVALRRLLVDLTTGTNYDLSAFDKQQGKAQQPYSHVIDAMMTFMLALDKHQGEGSLRVTLNRDDSIWGNIDEHGELKDRLFSCIATPQSQLGDPVAVIPQSATHKAMQLLKGTKPHQVYSREIFRKNSIGLSFYDLALIDGKLYKGFVEGKEDKKQFIRANEKPIDSKLDTLNDAAGNGLYRKTLCGETPVYYADKPKIIKMMFDVLEQAKDQQTFDPNSLESLVVKWLFGKSAGALYYYTTSSGLEAAPGIVAKSGASPFMNQWKAHYDTWRKCYPDTKVDRGSWVIAPELSQAWEQHCAMVLNRDKHDENDGYAPLHQADKRYTMRTITSVSGAMALVKRAGRSSPAYQLLAINTNELPKEHSAALALMSPNLVLFDKTVLNKGYQSKVEEKRSIQGAILKPDQLLKVSICEELGLETKGLEIVIRTATSVEIKGLKESWFEEHLVLSHRESNGELHKMSSLLISNEPKDEAVVNQGLLKLLLKRACRTDKPAKVSVVEGYVTLTLPFKTPALRALVE